MDDECEKAIECTCTDECYSSTQKENAEVYAKLGLRDFYIMQSELVFQKIRLEQIVENEKLILKKDKEISALNLQLSEKQKLIDSYINSRMGKVLVRFQKLIRKIMKTRS